MKDMIRSRQGLGLDCKCKILLIESRPKIVLMRVQLVDEQLDRIFTRSFVVEYYIHLFSVFINVVFQDTAKKVLHCRFSHVCSK